MQECDIVKLYCCLSCHYKIIPKDLEKRVFYMYSISKTHVLMSFWISGKLSMVESALFTLSNILCLVRKINSCRRLSLRGRTVINRIVF